MHQCQACNNAQATIHITDIGQGSFTRSAEGAESDTGALPDGQEQPAELEDKHLCNQCASGLGLANLGVAAKTVKSIFNLLHETARQARRSGSLTCPDCGMTLAEFRSKGRLGCAKDYEVFREHLDPLLLRIHNATEHVGRGPGTDAEAVKADNRLLALRQALETAVREELYEKAAELRDEIEAMEGSGGEEAQG